MIQVENLTKCFDNTPALTDISLNIQKGSTYGLIGSNGAGKTTLLKHIAGILMSDSGKVLVDGKESFENTDIKKRVAFIPDGLSFFNRYTLKSAKAFYRNMYPVWDDDIYNDIIEKFDLEQNKKLSKFSKGMQKQAVFALALAVKPDYLILDEPIDGLDPLAKKIMWQYIVKASADREMTTLVSSHSLTDMENICDYVGILSKGSLVLESDLDELKQDLFTVQISFYEDADSKNRYGSLNVLHFEKRGTIDLLIVKEKQETLENFAAENNPAIFEIMPLSLEEIFINEMGGKNDELKNFIF